MRRLHRTSKGANPFITLLDRTGFIVAKKGQETEPLNEEILPELQNLIHQVFTRGQKEINYTVSSYTLKHFAERVLGKYVSNGDFIKAMINEGFGYIPDELNAYFNISDKDISNFEAISKVDLNELFY